MPNAETNHKFFDTTIVKSRKITLPDNLTTEELMTIDLGYNYSQKELIEDWNRLKRVRVFKSGSQWKPGLKICQQFCDNFFNIRAINGKSFNDVKSDYNEMGKVLSWGKEKMSALYISWLRRAIFMRWGGHNPTYYRPHLAKQIILSTGKFDGVLLDPCAGWGGRMLGTIAGNWKYIGCEPNKKTYQNLLDIIGFTQIQNAVDLRNIPFENLDLTTIGKVDVVLTSPPYFNLETYSDEDTQSYIKYNTYDEWLQKWLLKSVMDCLNVLSDDGLSCWNVMDFKGIKIVDAIIDVHKKFGFELIDAIGIDSPFINYKKTLNKKDLTYIFKKKV
jgi:hypothetical protein